MKLFFCPLCHDIVKMIEGEMRHCACGKCGGRYKTKEIASIEGRAIPIVIDNDELIFAIQLRSPNLICKFTAAVIPTNKENCVIKEDMCRACRMHLVNHELRPIQHPENKKDSKNEGYQVYECGICGEIWGCRYQYDPRCGNDDRWKAFGKDSTMVRRHY